MPPGKKTIDIAAQFMRVRRAGAGGVTPDVDVSSNDNGGLFLDLPVPAGDGVGAAVDVSALGTYNTVAVLGTWEGVVIIEISEDNVTWSQCMGFQNPGYQSKEFVAQFMRVRRSGTAVLGLPPGTPNVDVGAINDAVSSTVPSDTAGVASNCLVFQPGGAAVGPAVFNTWPALMAQLAILRAAAGGNTCYTIMIDDSVLSPAVIPAGAYDMENVTLSGGQLSSAAGAQVICNLADGVTMPNLKSITGNIQLRSLSAVTSPVALSAGDLIEISNGANVGASAAAPFFNDPGMAGGSLVVIKADNVATLGDGTNPFINMDGTTVLALSLGSQAEVAADALDLAAGVTLIPSYRDDSGFINDDQTPMLGTNSPIVLVSRRWRVRGPFTSIQTAAINDAMRCDPSGGGFVINLPAITTFNAGQTICVKNITGSTNPITITRAGADTIDGAATRPIVTAFEAVILMSDGVGNWDII